MVVGTVNTTCCNQIHLNLLHSQEIFVIHALAPAHARSRPRDILRNFHVQVLPPTSEVTGR